MLDLLTRQFAHIGARLTVAHTPRIRRPFDLDIRTDAKGEHFRLQLRDRDRAFRVLQANAAARHLLLHTAGDNGGERFLCGHDERHWFAAALDARVTTITDAKRALLPPALRALDLPVDVVARRHTAAFKRQGEWFFVPTARDLANLPILHGEPLQRGRTGKPHRVSELIRFGGTPVVLCGGREYTDAEWKAATDAEPKLRVARWQRFVKDPEVYVRGKVRHRDHATLVLDGWHRVYVNGEVRSENLSFYD